MAMPYHVKEIYYTLQGEGAQAGRPAVFCRFAGCNLWTGREEDRAEAVCSFCDTDFVGVDGPGGGVFPGPDELARAVASVWPGTIAGCRPLVVCSGGEPLLQLDADAVAALKRAGFEVAIETNGTRPVPPGVDWVCVSPKAGAPLFFIQPMDGPFGERAVRQSLHYCLEHPVWRLSLQLQKILGIP
jgi:7-carboxy-7-deazaguanine synthase (Cx14CxxC type)